MTGGIARLFSNWPLRRQIVLVIGGTIFLVGVFSAEFVRNVETSAFERNFNYQTEKLVAMLSATSLDAIVSEDRPVLATTVQQLLENDSDVIGVEIINENGEALVQWHSVKEESLRKAGNFIDFSHDVTLEGESFGRMNVSWNVQKQHADIQEHARRIYVYALAL